MPLWWFLIALVFRTATCLFYSRFFCYSWRKKEEKSLFKGQKVSDMWLSTSKLLLQSFFALAARPLWDLTVDMYPHVRIFGLHCPQTSGGGSQPLHCWPDFWACSVESRPAKVGHGDVPSAEKNVSYSTGHIWLVGILVFPFGTERLAGVGRRLGMAGQPRPLVACLVWAPKAFGYGVCFPWEGDSWAGLEQNFASFILPRPKKKYFLFILFFNHINNDGKQTLFFSCLLSASKLGWLCLLFII